eukprot:6212669-Pleurochrysis_carterae.AAC.2
MSVTLSWYVFLRPVGCPASVFLDHWDTSHSVGHARVVIQNLRNGTRSARVRMPRENQLENCACMPKGAARCDGLINITSRRLIINRCDSDTDDNTDIATPPIAL